MAGFRKRVYSRAFGGTGNRRFKKRRTGKFKRKSKRSVAYTSQSGSGGKFGFNARKVSKGRWRNMLWNSTLQKQHYRTSWAVNVNFNTGASTVSSQVRLLNADDNGSGAFWTAGGGAVTPNTGAALPTFAGDIILRGGTMGLILGNATDTLNDGLRVQVMLVKSTQDFDTTGFPTNAPVGWDATLHPDFKRRIGTVMMQRQVLISQGESQEIKYRRRIQKIDQGDYTAGVGRFFWVIVVSNVYLGSVQALSATTYFNGSFSADGL